MAKHKGRTKRGRCMSRFIKRHKRLSRKRRLGAASKACTKAKLKRMKL